MKGRVPRIAFFTDSFHEVNGVALTSRQFAAFAKRRELPFLAVHAGQRTSQVHDGSVTRLEFRRGWGSFALDSDLAFDLLLWRYRNHTETALKQFQPDLIHITGPGDFGLLGAVVAYRMKVPLVASWHTNVHEYAGRRLERMLHFLPEKPLHRLGALAERVALHGAARFYQLAKLLFAPNPELVDRISAETGRPCFLMQRGIETDLFHPSRTPDGDRPFTIGFTGRLSPEKNVRLLARIEQSLLAAGHTRFRILVVGTGSELGWLKSNLTRGEFTGVLKGEALARAYAGMDVFAFPSHTDTFGNVILEALASGVPAVVTSGGGPKFLVRSGETGFVAADDAAFVKCIRTLFEDRELKRQMGRQAREYALDMSWDRVFERVYEAYGAHLPAMTGAIRIAS